MHKQIRREDLRVAVEVTIRLDPCQLEALLLAFIGDDARVQKVTETLKGAADRLENAVTSATP